MRLRLFISIVLISLLSSILVTAQDEAIPITVGTYFGKSRMQTPLTVTRLKVLKVKKSSSQWMR